MRQTYAFMRGCRIYTLKPCHPDPLTGRKPPFRYHGFMDGETCGFFKSKKEFEAFVASEPDDFLDTNQPHVQASLRAQSRSEWEGRHLLARLKETRGKVES